VPVDRPIVRVLNALETQAAFELRLTVSKKDKVSLKKSTKYKFIFVIFKKSFFLE